METAREWENSGASQNGGLASMRCIAVLANPRSGAFRATQNVVLSSKPNVSG
jgi:hypothetical protein